jgi:1-acyl-sn-glycerol-3-phosphate acyltransferase
MITGSHLLKRRRGIFKMALETGTPLVPVISVGEEKLYDCVGVPGWIQDYLAPYDICIAIPTLSSVAKWVGLLQHPLKDRIHSIVGKPIPVEKKDMPTEGDIAALRLLYINTLVKMYKEDTEQDIRVE